MITRSQRCFARPGSATRTTAMEDEVKEPSAPASPQQSHTRLDTSSAVDSVLAAARSAAQRTSPAYTHKDAFRVSVASLILTVCAFCAGLAISVHTQSSAALGYALENAVDAVGSLLVLWRFWGNVSEAQLELREKRADIGIALMFVVLGVLVAVNASVTLATHKEADNHAFLLGLSVPSAFLFGFLGFYKLRVAEAVDSQALRKDGFCSLAGACLSCGVLVGYFLMVEADIWWPDGLVAISVGIVLVGAGALSLRKNRGLRWWSLSFWVEAQSRAATKRRARAEVVELGDDRVDALAARVEAARGAVTIGASNMV